MEDTGDPYPAGGTVTPQEEMEDTPAYDSEMKPEEEKGISSYEEME